MFVASPSRDRPSLDTRWILIHVGLYSSDLSPPVQVVAPPSALPSTFQMIQFCEPSLKCTGSMTPPPSSSQISGESVTLNGPCGSWDLATPAHRLPPFFLPATAV